MADSIDRSPLPIAHAARSTSTRRALLGAAAVGLGAGVAHYLGQPGPEGLDVHLVPRALPVLHVSDARGAVMDLSAWRGRAVLLNIWATWCAPCREEMPTLDRLQAALGGSGFEVIAVSIDAGGLPAVQEFFRLIGVRHLQPYLQSSHEASQLALGGIPLTLLIDAHGREVARKRGLAHWDTAAMQRVIRRYIP